MNLMAQYHGSHEIFDYFVVPTVAKPKQIRDTISTIEALSDIGISSEKSGLYSMIEDPDTDIQKNLDRYLLIMLWKANSL